MPPTQDDPAAHGTGLEPPPSAAQTLIVELSRHVELPGVQAHARHAPARHDWPTAQVRAA